MDSALSGLLADNVVVWSAVTSQVISNVPTAILFAEFTDDYRQLLVGVNIGGVGTVVASLASLITVRHIEKCDRAMVRPFMLQFSMVNFGLLAVLLVVAQVAFAWGFI